MGEYIDAFSLLDSSLLFAFDAKIETHLELDDIQSGSIKALIRRILNIVDDDALKAGNWNQVLGGFLHDAKVSILKWCNDNEEISDPELINAETKEINVLAENTDLHHIPLYRPFTPQALISSVQGLAQAGRILQITDKVTYRSGGNELEVSKSVSFAPQVLDEFLGPQSGHVRQKAVVIIKKADFLGNSQWEVRFEDRTIRAHISDSDWLTSFKKRQFDIKPGDALRVILDIYLPVDTIGKRGEPSYEIVEVLGIVPGVAGEQQDLLE